MKKCPHCQQIFDDDINFCLHDGTTLVALGRQSGNSVPTQIIPSFPTREISKGPGNNHLYSIIGALAAVLLMAVGAIVYLAFFRNPAENSNSENKAALTQSPPGNSQQSSPTNIQPKNTNLQSEDLRISEEDVKNLLGRWEKAQDSQNFAAYQACYGQPFLGIKRTRSGTAERMNYAQWMNDRRKMLATAVSLDIEIKNLQISIEGDTATAEFDQYYRSVKYCDWGPKVLKIKMLADGARIVYEDLKASNSLPC